MQKPLGKIISNSKGKETIVFNGLHLSEMIIESYLNDELIVIAIHGKQGYGKSTYASLVQAQVYGAINTIESLSELPKSDPKYFKELKQKYNSKNTLNLNYTYDYNNCKEYLAFTPRQFLYKSRNNKYKSPSIIVDDAGLWLNSLDFNHPLVKAVGKFLEVGRTKWGAIIFTCSDLSQIFSKVRNMPHVYTVRINKHSSANKNRRIASIHQGWSSEDLKKSGKKKIAIDLYNAVMPDDFFTWYKPERDSLAHKGLNDIEEILEKYKI